MYAYMHVCIYAYVFGNRSCAHTLLSIMTTGDLLLCCGAAAGFVGFATLFVRFGAHPYRHMVTLTKLVNVGAAVYSMNGSTEVMVDSLCISQALPYQSDDDIMCALLPSVL